MHQQIIHNEVVNLHYSKVGSATKVVLCIHGINRNSRDFDYLAASLSQTHTVICVDIFGRGKSSWLLNHRNYNYNTYYHAVINLLNHLQVSQVSLIGTSMGGIISMYVAAFNPNLVQNIILNDIGPEIPLLSLQKLAFYVKQFPIFNSKSEAYSYLQNFLSPLNIKDSERLSHMINNSLIVNSDGKYCLNYDPAIGIKFDEDVKNMNSNMDLWSLWKKITQPVLVLRGGKSNILTDNTAQKMMVTQQNAQLIKYSGVGHTPSLTEEKQIADVVKWLNTKS